MEQLSNYYILFSSIMVKCLACVLVNIESFSLGPNVINFEEKVRKLSMEVYLTLNMNREK